MFDNPWHPRPRKGLWEGMEIAWKNRNIRTESLDRKCKSKIFIRVQIRNLITKRIAQMTVSIVWGNSDWNPRFQIFIGSRIGNPISGRMILAQMTMSMIQGDSDRNSQF